MTRGRTSPQVAADTASHSGGAVLLEFNFDSGTLYLCLGRWTITYGGNAYVHTGAALSVQAHGEAADGTEGLEVTMTGLEPGIFDLVVSEPYQRRPMRLLELRFDADDQPVGDPSTEFPGRMTAMTAVESPKDRSMTVVVQCEHWDADGRRPRNIRFSDAEQQRRFPGDMGAQYVASMVERVMTRAGR